MGQETEWEKRESKWNGQLQRPCHAQLQYTPAFTMTVQDVTVTWDYEQNCKAGSAVGCGCAGADGINCWGG